MVRAKTALLIIFLISTHLANAGEIKKGILNFKLDRFYFDSGTEALIFDNCKFTVINKKDTVYSGLIEQSLPGISFSQPLDHFFDSLNYKKYSVLIETGDIDSLTPIIINCRASEYNDIIKLYYTSKYFSDDTTFSIGATSYGNEIKFEKQMFYFNAFSNSTKDQYNLHITYNRYDNTKIIETAAPYIAILLPNPTKAINQSNYLSNSLYYRFDPDKLPYMFDGEDVNAYDCFYQPDSSCTRDYLYDPQKGIQVLKYLPSKPNELTVSVNHPSLILAANYFGDVLSRDKIKLTTLVSNPDADFILTYIPLIESQPEIGLDRLLNLLKSYSELTLEQTKSIELMENHLKSSEGITVSEIKNYYFKLIDYSLKYDYGIFPLFRPSLMIQYEDNINNCAVDENGILDFSNLTKIKMPASLKENK